MRLAVLLANFGLLASGVQSKYADEWITTIWDHFKEAVDCSSCQVWGQYLTALQGWQLIAARHKLDSPGRSQAGR